MDAYMFLLCKYSSFTPKMQGRRMGTSGRAITKSTSVSGEMYTLEHNDGSQSDTAVGTVGTGGKKRRSSLSAKVVAIVTRRSRSTSQLSQTGEWSEFNLHISSSRWRDKCQPSCYGSGWDRTVYGFSFPKNVCFSVSGNLFHVWVFLCFFLYSCLTRYHLSIPEVVRYFVKKINK